MMRHRSRRTVPGIRAGTAVSALLALALTLALWLAGKASPDAAAAAASVRPGGLERIVAKLVGATIERHHFSRRPLTNEISKQFYAEYFKRLDHGRSFFLDADIKEFISYEANLDDLVLQGNVDFAFDVYERFLQRVRERVVYMKQRLEEPFDFDQDEQVVIDRSEEPWCTTKEELDELWRLKLKNSLLVYEMMQRPKNTAKQDDPKDGTKRPPPADGADAKPAPETEDQPQTPPAPDEKAGAESGEKAGSAGSEKPAVAAVKPQKPPKQRVLEFYERYLRQMEQKGGMEILEIYLSALTRIYDPHSVYMAPDTEENFDITMKLSLQGIGALLTTEDAFVKVAGIIPGGPAEQDGRLKEGDRIIAVAQKDKDAVDVIDMPLSKVVRMIRGTKGTVVYLTVLEADKGLGSVPTVIDITRNEVKLTEQEAKLEIRTVPGATDDSEEATAAARIGIINLPSFYTDFAGKSKGLKDYKSSTRDVRRLVDEAKAEDVDGIILDLRSNGGGGLAEAVSLAGLFFPEGPVVQQVHKDGRIQRHLDPDGTTVYDDPLVILVDRLSASASEIVAAALQDYGRAVVVGDEHTHGKGTVQTIYHLDRRLRLSTLFKDKKAGSLKFTVAKFYRVTGGSTQVRGVTPDIVFSSFTDHMELGEAHMPNRLPWDRIEALDISRTDDVTAFLPTLKSRAQARLAADEQYQDLLGEIGEYAERRERKTLTVNKAERVKLQKEDEAWSKKLSQVNRRRRRSTRKKDTEKEKEKEKEAPADFVLERTVDIATDLILLHNQQRLPPLDTGAIAKAEPPKADAASPAAAPGETGTARNAATETGAAE